MLSEGCAHSPFQYVSGLRLPGKILALLRFHTGFGASIWSDLGMILGELNRSLGVDGSSCAWEGQGPSGYSMFYSGLASSLWSHSFNLGLVFYLRCLPFGELNLLFLTSCGGSLSEPIMLCYKEKRIW